MYLFIIWPMNKSTLRISIFILFFIFYFLFFIYLSTVITLIIRTL